MLGHFLWVGGVGWRYMLGRWFFYGLVEVSVGGWRYILGGWRCMNIFYESVGGSGWG